MNFFSTSPMNFTGNAEPKNMVPYWPVLLEISGDPVGILTCLAH